MMAEVNYIQKKGEMSLNDIVKLQILLHCHLNDITISESDLECLTLLGIEGETNLLIFVFLQHLKKYFLLHNLLEIH